MKYIEYTNRDGMGQQLRVYSKILQFANQYNLIPIFDFRKKCYFKNIKCDTKQLDRYFSFHENIIYKSEEIDEIDDNNIFKIGKKHYRNKLKCKKYKKMLNEYKTFKLKNKPRMFVRHTRF